MIQSKPPLLAEFLNSLNHSTSLQYKRDLERFIEFTNYVPIESIPMGLCLQYKASMSQLSPNTINRRLNSVRSYYEFLIRYGSMTANPMECVQRAKGAYNPTNGLTNDETNRILSMTANPMHSAVLHCLFYLGLRRSEVCKLCIDDLSTNQTDSTIRIQGKGGKQRVLLIPLIVANAIQVYLSSRAHSIRNTSEPLFVTTKKPKVPLSGTFDNSQHLENASLACASIHNTKRHSKNSTEFEPSPNPLHPQTIAQIFKSACHRANINKRVSPHSARVTAVSNALENGANPVYVQEMGGWSSMNMLLIYDKRRKEIKNCATRMVNYGKV